MSMYDELKFNSVLPGVKDYQSLVFQTKSFRCEFKTYEISAKDRLLCDGQDTNYHGYLIFYGEDKARVFRQFQARFSNGTLVFVREMNNLHQLAEDNFETREWVKIHKPDGRGLQDRVILPIENKPGERYVLVLYDWDDRLICYVNRENYIENIRHWHSHTEAIVNWIWKNGKYAEREIVL
jgi:hypothetical protein